MTGSCTNLDNWTDAVANGQTTLGLDDFVAARAAAKPTNLYVIRQIADPTKFWARDESEHAGWAPLERASVYVTRNGRSARPSEAYEWIKLTKVDAA